MEKLPNSVPESLLGEANELTKQLGFEIIDQDLNRPWGGFYVLPDESAQVFAATFFPEVSFDSFDGLSPKFLFVAPGQRLSWQYHNRRAEHWKAIHGPAGYITSEDDSQGDVQTLQTGELVQFGVEVRHRLVGLQNWGLVAEIWEHTDPANPSNEDDIVRVEDDYGR